MRHEIICPSGLRGTIRGIMVTDERILADEALAKNGRQLDELLKACWLETLDPGPYHFDGSQVEWDKVLRGDRLYALLQIRALTYGADYAFSVRCRNDTCRPI